MGAFLNEFFYYGARRYEVVNKTKTLELKETSVPQAWQKKFFKVMLIFTGIVPLIAGIRKLIQIRKWSAYSKITIIIHGRTALTTVKVSVQNRQILPSSSVSHDKNPQTLNPAVVTGQQVPDQDLAKRIAKFNSEEQSLKKLGENYEEILQKYGTYITYLDLEGRDQATALRYLKYCPHVESVHLSGRLLDNQGIEEIARLPLRSLKKLDFGDATRTKSLSPEDIRTLVSSENLKNVTFLDLSNCDLRNEGAKYLLESPHLKSLTVLCLQNCGLLDEGVEHLCHIKNLIELELSCNIIGLKGAQGLANSENSKSLKMLNLKLNQIGFEGAIALAESLHFEKLDLLDIQCNGVDMSQVAQLKAKFRSNIRSWI